MTETFQVQRLTPTAILPRRAKTGDAGHDLFADLGGEGRRIMLLPGQRAGIPTGCAIVPPPGTYGRIAEKSGLALNRGVRVGGGVCDRNFRGGYVVIVTVGVEWFLPLVDGVLGEPLAPEPLVIAHGDKIAQLVFERISEAVACDLPSLSPTDRGAAGFGSTGAR